MIGLRVAGGQELAFEQAQDGPLLGLEPNISAIVLAKLNVCSELDQNLWANPATDSLIRTFVEEGNGLLVIHAGTVGYQEAKAIRAMTGGAFLHHPEACQVSIEPESSDGEVLSFQVHDEHYFVELDPEQDVFLKSISAYGEQPAGWRRRFGLGRVSVITPGHFQAVWDHPQFQNLLRIELDWVVYG